MNKRWLRIVAVLAALALVAAACGDDEGGDDTTTTAGPTTTGATTTTAATTAPTETSEPPAEVATGVGVTAEPCPGGAADRGCIYLGVLTDESGPFAAAAPALFGANQAFWAAANAQGGIGGAYDVAVPEDLKRDTQYNPEKFVTDYQSISGEVAAIAQSLGTPQTIAALDSYARDNTLAAPASWWSGWAFDASDGGGLVLEFGTNYCFEAMNAVDWSVSASPAAPTTAGILFFPTDYGADYAAGVKLAAAANGIEVAWEVPVIPISAGGDPGQVEAIDQVLNNPVDTVYLVTGPSETAAIVGGAAARGYQNMFIGAAPSWNVGLLASPAAPAFEAGLYFQSSYVGPWDYDSVGHETMRATLTAAGVVDANDFFISGWVSQYPLRAALEAALANGDLTRAGIASAAAGLTDVDFQGMLANRNYTGDPADNFPRESLVGAVDTSSSTGITVVQDFFVGPTAMAHDFSAPCAAA